MRFIKILCLLLCLLCMAMPAFAAFPVVAATNTTADTDGTSTVINMPASISAGNLLVCWDTNDASLTPRSQSGGSDWTRIDSGSRDATDDISMAIFAKIAAGGDALTLAGAAQDAATVCARITGHGVTNVSVDILLGSKANGLDAAPDPPTVTHGGPQDYLVLESSHSDDDDDTATYWSSGYSAVNQVQSASSTTSCLTGVGQLGVNNTAENPGVMALAAAEDWIAQTISVPPVLPTEYTKITDDFTRADENPLSNGGVWDTYTGVDALQVVSNDIRGTVLAPTVDNYQTNDGTLTDSQWAQATLSEVTVPAAGFLAIGLLLRAAAPNTDSSYLFAGIAGGSNQYILQRVVAGVETNIASTTAGTEPVTNDVLKFYAIGSRLTGLVNGVSKLTAVDTTHTSGRAGALITLSNAGAALTNGQMDGWSAGDFTAPAGACAGTRLLVGVGC